MNVEIISIGDELLIGETVNTNATYISRKLTEIGMDVKWVTTIGDNENDLLKILKLAEKRADIVISTGGLGPTHDDRTKYIFAKYFNTKKFVLNEHVLDKIKTLFSKRNIDMPKINVEQARIPENSTMIENDFGTAPGLIFERDNKLFFVLPGVPLEMKTMLDNKIIPMLQKQSNRFIKQKIIKTVGISESALFEQVGDIEEYEKYVKISFLPKSSGVEICLTATGQNENQCLNDLTKVENDIKTNISTFIWGYDNDEIEHVVANLLFKKKKSIAIAESSTGGMLLNRLAYNPKAFNLIKQGIFLNTPDSIAENLEITLDLDSVTHLQTSQTALKMADAIRKLNNVDLGIATSPFLTLPDEPGKWEGEILYVAISGDREAIYDSIFVNRDLDFNKKRITQLALDLLRRYLTEY